MFAGPAKNFALFAAVIVALVLEPLPGGAVGLLALTVAVIMLIPQVALLMPLYTALVGGDITIAGGGLGQGRQQRVEIQ